MSTDETNEPVEEMDSLTKAFLESRPAEVIETPGEKLRYLGWLADDEVRLSEESWQGITRPEPRPGPIVLEMDMWPTNHINVGPPTPPRTWLHRRELQSSDLERRLERGGGRYVLCTRDYVNVQANNLFALSWKYLKFKLTMTGWWRYLKRKLKL